MKCSRVEKFLPLHVAGDLAERRARAIENHLAACEKCRLTAGEYLASRDMFSAATLSPDFEVEFYEEIRNSVLARISRDRTPAPLSGFSRLFNARLAVAASLSLLLVAAALALHSYTRRASEGGARERAIAVVERTATPATIKSPQATGQENDGRAAPRASGERAPRTTSRKQRATGLSPSGTSANIESARSTSPRSLNTTSRAPLTAGRNPHALAVAATERADAEKINAGGGHGEANPSPEVSRIEIQTSNPDIRIIWLSPKAGDATHPLK